MKNVMIVEDQKMIRSILEGYIDRAADFLLAASVEGAERACEICEEKKDPSDFDGCADGTS